MKILIISDIHGNYPALKAVSEYFSTPFDLILNGGDTTVYGPFPNQTINWLRTNNALSILGNTDRHIITLLQGKTFKKPRKPDKRIMYGWTASQLSDSNRNWILEQPLYRTIDLTKYDSDLGSPFTLGMYHGSPDDPDEFLFEQSPQTRFEELAGSTPHRLITVGHSHSPFHKQIGPTHFINPGSIGRMFDGNPSASCAVADILRDSISVNHYRISYPVEEVNKELAKQRLPSIYQEMYRVGRKLN